MSPANIRVNMLFASQHLVLVGVPWHWAVSLKLVRFKESDQRDIACILRMVQPPRVSHPLSTEGWTPAVLEGWLRYACSGMCYHVYTPDQYARMTECIRWAIALAQRGAGHPAALQSVSGSQRHHALAGPSVMMNRSQPELIHSLGIGAVSQTR